MKELLFIIVLIFSFVCKGQYEHIRSGDLLYDKGYYKEAATSYTLYLNSFPRDVNTQLKLSKSYLALFDEVSAEKPLMEAFRLSKRVSYEMYFTRGIYYQFKHKYNLALKDFRKVPYLGNPELQKKIILHRYHSQLLLVILQ